MLTLIANDHAATITVPIEMDIIALQPLFIALESLLHAPKSPKLVSAQKHV